MDRHEALQRLRDCGFTDTEILNELTRAMSNDEALENFEHIARMNGTERSLNLANTIAKEME